MKNIQQNQPTLPTCSTCHQPMRYLNTDRKYQSERTAITQRPRTRPLERRYSLSEYVQFVCSVLAFIALCVLIFAYVAGCIAWH